MEGGRRQRGKFADSVEWRIRVTRAKVSTDHRRLISKEQSQNLARKRENKDPLRVNLLPSLTSPPYLSNPELAGPWERKSTHARERERERQLDVSMPRISLLLSSLEFSISRKPARESLRLFVISLGFTACVKENVIAPRENSVPWEIEVLPWNSRASPPLRERARGFQRESRSTFSFVRGR